MLINEIKIKARKRSFPTPLLSLETTPHKYVVLDKPENIEPKFIHENHIWAGSVLCNIDDHAGCEGGLNLFFYVFSYDST